MGKNKANPKSRNMFLNNNITIAIRHYSRKFVRTPQLFIGIFCSLFLLFLRLLPSGELFLVPLTLLTAVFVPGWYILSMFPYKKTKPPIEEFLVTCVCVGIVVQFCIGLLLNFSLNRFGYTQPISKSSVLGANIVLLLLLSAITTYKNVLLKPRFSIVSGCWRVKLLSINLVTIAIIGSYYLNNYGNIMFIVVFYFLIIIYSITTIYVDNSQVHILCILISISLGLLLQSALVPGYLTSAGDSLHSFQYSQLVYSSGYWDPTVSTPFNSLIGTNLFIPLIGKLANVSLTNVYRVVYPLLFSVIPVGAYSIYKHVGFDQIDAYLGSLITMFVFSYYTILQANIRTGLAELFLIGLLLIYYSGKQDPDQRIPNYQSIYLLIIGTGIIVAHYGTAFIILPVIIGVAVTNHLLIYFLPRYQSSTKFSLTIGVLLSLIMYVYYNISANAATFELLVGFMTTIPNELQSFFSVVTDQLGIYSSENQDQSVGLPLSMVVSRNLLLLSGTVIGGGIIVTLGQHVFERLDFPVQKVDIEYTMTAAVGLFIVGGFLLVQSSYGFTRAGHMILLLSAPFVVFPFKLLVSRGLDRPSGLATRQLLIVFIVVLFAFNSGLVAETVTRENDFSPNTAIHNQRADTISHPKYVYENAREYYTIYDHSSAMWLIENRNPSITIRTDGGVSVVGSTPLRGYVQLSHLRPISTDSRINDNSYTYFRTYNIRQCRFITQSSPPMFESCETMSTYVEHNELIYNNSQSKIHH